MPLCIFVALVAVSEWWDFELRVMMGGTGRTNQCTSLVLG